VRRGPTLGRVSDPDCISPSMLHQMTTVCVCVCVGRGGRRGGEMRGREEEIKEGGGKVMIKYSEY